MAACFRFPRLVTTLLRSPRSCRRPLSAQRLPCFLLTSSSVPLADQPDTISHHGKSRGCKCGGVRHPMASQLIFSNLSCRREGEGEESTRPTVGKESPASPRKNRRRYASSQRHRAPSLDIGFQVQETSEFERLRCLRPESSIGVRFMYQPMVDPPDLRPQPGS